MGASLTRCTRCGGLSEQHGVCAHCRQEVLGEGVEDVRRSFTELWADEGAKWSGVAGGITAGVALAVLASVATHGAALGWIAPQVAGGHSRTAFLWYSVPFWVVRIVAELQARCFRGALDLFEEEEFAIGSIVAVALGVALLFGAYLAYNPEHFSHPVSPADVRLSVWWLTPWLCQIAGIVGGVVIYRRLRDRIL